MYSLMVQSLKIVCSKSIIDSNLAQRLFHRATVCIFIIFFIASTAGQFFGEPINCYHTSAKFSDDLIDKYCYWSSNYILIGKDTFTDTYLYPGVKWPQKTDDIYQVSYYQWVVYCFALQALLFYSGRYLYKSLDRRDTFSSVNRLKYTFDRYNIKAEESDLKSSRNNRSYVGLYRLSKIHYFLMDRTIDRFKPLYNLKNNKNNNIYYVLSEIINIVMLILQIYATDYLLNNNFLRLGYNFVTDPSADLLELVFPRVTKCYFRYYGPSGGSQLSDSLCVNTLNIFYEKVFIFLWFWYSFIFITAVVNVGLHIIWFVVFIECPCVLRFLLRDISMDSELGKLSKAIDYMGWLHLNNIKRNVDRDTFKFYIKMLCRELDLSMGVNE